MQRKLSKHITFLLLILSSVFIGCQKEKIKEIEKKYTGNFLFTVQEHDTSFMAPDFDTTFTYAGVISISDVLPQGVTEKEAKKIVYLKIHYDSPNRYILVNTQKDGTFANTGITGRFKSGDNNQLDFVVTQTGLSHSYTGTVHGVRR